MKMEGHTPIVLDPAGVQATAYPRAMRMGSDAEREQAAALNEGLPEVDFEGRSNPYLDYSSIDLLLSLQYPRSSGHDEMCFIIMGQVKELLFKALHYELFNAKRQIEANEVPGALEILKRAEAIMVYIGRSWDVLSTISPAGFKVFRDFLGAASGQLSFMYRHVEFVLGNKNVRLATAHRNLPHIWPAIQDSLNEPSIWDAVGALLSRRGHAIAPECLSRDWSLPYRADPSVEAAWLKVYADPTARNDLYLLGEGLIAFSDAFSQYRYRHFTSVERIIGMKPGTGGSAGVGWLRAVVDQRIFPELWTVRTRL